MEIKDRQICWRKSDEELSKPTDIDRPAAGVTWRTRANASQPSTRKVVRLVFLITRVIEIFDVDEKPLGNDRRGIGQNEKWPPPKLTQEIHALFLCFAAMVPLVIGEFIAAYLAMLTTTIAPGANRLADVQALQRAVLGLLTDAPNTLKEMFRATVGLLHGRQAGAQTEAK